MKIMFVSLAREEEPKEIWNTPHKLNKFFKHQGIKTLFLTLPKKVTFFHLVFYFLGFYIKYLRFRPNCIVGFHPITFIPLFYKKLGLIRKPIIYYWWDLDVECMGKSGGVSRIAFFEFFCVKNSNRVFTNSLFQKEMAKKFGVKCIYFRLGIEDYFKKNVKKRMLEGKNKFKILFFGDINKYKKVQDLIRSMQNIKADLIVIGSVSENLGLKLPKNVYLTGFKPHKELPSYIKSADIIAIPTDQDGTLKMFEALRMGKCILAFQGRIAYVLRHLENAYLCKDFEDGINFLRKNQRIMKKIEKNNLKIKVPYPEEVFKLQLQEIKEVINNKCAE